MNLASLLDDFENNAAPSAEGATEPVTPAPIRRMAVASRPASAPMTESDLRVMIGEARRDVKRQSGLVGQVMNRLRGDDLQRRQYETLLRRIDGWDATEEAKLAIFLNASLSILGVQVATSAIQEMDDHVRTFQPGSPAAQMGERMIAGHMETMPTQIEEITLRGQRRGLKPFGLDR